MYGDHVLLESSGDLSRHFGAQEREAEQTGSPTAVESKIFVALSACRQTSAQIGRDIVHDLDGPLGLVMAVKLGYSL